MFGFLCLFRRYSGLLASTRQYLSRFLAPKSCIDYISYRFKQLYLQTNLLRHTSMKQTKNTQSRRQFLGHTATILGAATISPTVLGAPSIISSYNKPNSRINGVQIGAITYSFRSMADQSAEATLKYVVDSGINAIELMGDPAETFAGRPENPIDRRAFFQLRRKSQNGELTDEQKMELVEMQAKMKAHGKEVAEWRTSVSMDRFAQIKTMYQDAGVKIYGFKPSAFSQRNSDAEIDYGFRAAKTLGANHVTLEHPSDDAHTQKLGKIAAQHKMYVAYHGHEQQTPTLWDTALEQSEYNNLNLDLGHYVAAGNPDPRELISAKHARISSMHLKDRQNPENGKANMPWGKGDTPIIEVLQLMRDNKYTFPATAELEYEIPEGSDAVKELSKCLEYCRRALQA